MAIAHVCVQCGKDLARVRSRREPVYGLNLVTCPGCGKHSVRRVHPIRSGWRRFRRFDFAMTMMAMRFGGLIALTVLCTLGSIIFVALPEAIADPRRQHDPQATVLFAIVFFVLLPVLLGMFLAAGFAHIKMWKMWLGWLGWMALVLFMVSLHGPLDSEFDPRYGMYNRDGRLAEFIIVGITHVAFPATVGTAIMLIVALPGAVIGRLLLRLGAPLRSAKWRWRRRRLKLARAANV